MSGGTEMTEEKEVKKTNVLEEYYDMEFHRGGRDARPENTLYSYQYAIENGATTIECDIQQTKDGQLVMSHNPVLNADLTTDANGEYVPWDEYFIRDMTMEEVQNFNVGRMRQQGEYYELHGRSQVTADTHIPSLRQLFELVRDSGNEDIRMSIEAKAYADPALGPLYEKRAGIDEMLSEFLSLVKEFGLEDRVTLQSFDWAFLVRMKEMDPKIDTIALYSEQSMWGPTGDTLWADRDEPSPWLAGLDIHDFDGDPVKAAASLGIDNVSPYWTELTKDQVEFAHEHGMRVVPWTVNDVADLEIVYGMGVDGIISDRPWVLREFLESKGEKLLPVRTVDLPYHLETDHNDIEIGKIEGGRDAAC